MKLPTPNARTVAALLFIILGAAIIASCGGTPTAPITPPTPTIALVVPTATAVPPTATAVLPTATKPAAPTATAVPPTATTLPPTATKPVATAAPTSAPATASNSTNCITCHTDKATLEKLATKTEAKSEQTSGEG